MPLLSAAAMAEVNESVALEMYGMTQQQADELFIAVLVSAFFGMLSLVGGASLWASIRKRRWRRKSAGNDNP